MPAKVKNAPKVAPEGQQVQIHLPEMRIQRLRIMLIGDSPLICHRWSEKATKQMLDKQMKKAQAAKGAKDPKQDYLDSLYPHPAGGYGFPAVGFKSAATDACSYIAGLTKVLCRGAFHISSDLVKVKGEPRPRQDMVRLQGSTADVRHRGEFRKWSVVLEIAYNASVLSAEQITNLFNVAGFAVGVGEWRPQRNGSFGRFHVATEQEAA